MVVVGLKFSSEIEIKDSEKVTTGSFLYRHKSEYLYVICVETRRLLPSCHSLAKIRSVDRLGRGRPAAGTTTKYPSGTGRGSGREWSSTIILARSSGLGR